MAKLTKRADGRYAKQVTVGIKDGKPVKKTVYGKTIKETEEKYHKLLTEMEKGYSVDLTIQELSEQWYKIKKERNVTIQSKHVYLSRLNRINDTLGGYKAREVNVMQVNALIDDITMQGHTALAKYTLSMLSSIFEYGASIGAVTFNPCKAITVHHDPHPRRPLTELELKRIHRADLEIRDKTILYLLLYTGARKGEIMALNKSDIDFTMKSIHICKTIVHDGKHTFIQNHTKTKTSMRYIPIFQPLLPVLEEYLKTTDPEKELLFPSPCRKRDCYTDGGLGDMFRTIFRKAGLGEDITPHCFRHTFITRCYEAGIPIKKLQAWVGHSDISTTLNTYTHIKPETLLDGSDMDAVFMNDLRKSNGSQINILDEKAL